MVNVELKEMNDTKNLEIENTVSNEVTQKNFLETTLGKTINTAIDIGIRAILPDFIDEQIIHLKNNLLNNGLKEGITKSVDEAIDLGKSAVGIVTGNFENINQMQDAIKTGGIIDGISNVLDFVVDKMKHSGLVNDQTANTIKQGKDVILNHVESNIESTFSDQLKAAELTNKYMNQWKEYYNNRDFDGMQKEYQKIQKEIKKLVPLEQTIHEARTIQNLHQLIKNNGKNFDLTPEELELAKKL